MSSISSRPALRAQQTAFVCSTRRNRALQPSQFSPLSRPPPFLPRHGSSTSIPSAFRPSFWYSLLPKFLRRTEPKTPQEIKSKEWNPATFYIIIFMLIGSQSIRMIGLRNEFRNFSSKSEAKLEVLREVIERLKRGENVDVERLLGTGDAAKEREWEDGIPCCLVHSIGMLTYRSIARNRGGGLTMAFEETAEVEEAEGCQSCSIRRKKGLINCC